MKAPGGILRTPRHRFTREGSLSRWDVDAKYHSVANRDERGQQPSVYRRSFDKKPKGCPEPIMGHDVRLTLVCQL